MGMGQGAKLSALNTQGLMHKAAKAESRAGWQANCPEELLAPSRYREKHKS
jgi:hypothetical protein